METFVSLGFQSSHIKQGWITCTKSFLNRWAMIFEIAKTFSSFLGKDKMFSFCPVRLLLATAAPLNI
jgi:hypothetical protein